MGKMLLFSTSMEMLRVPAKSVVYITADGNYSAITMADGTEYMLTRQLGQIEQQIGYMIDEQDNRFIRIGRALIVNADFITYINPPRQKLILSDCHTFRHELSASREALKSLKEYMEDMR